MVAKLYPFKDCATTYRHPRYHLLKKLLTTLKVTLRQALLSMIVIGCTCICDGTVDYTGEPIYFYMIGKNTGPNQVLVNENYQL